MSSACRRIAPARVAAALALLAILAAPATARDLRVCADPDNLPFSDAAGAGFENRIAAIVADELGARLSYTFRAQRRGVLRETLRAGLCDVVPGIARGVDAVRTTRPYYRSAYVFVSQPDGPAVASLDDPVLARLTVGVQLVGDDGANTPPVHALARRGLARNLRGFPVYGDAAAKGGRRIVDAVAAGEVDVAVVWGPTAGRFARAAGLVVRPVVPEVDLPVLPMAFDIAMGVRPDDRALRDELDAALAARRSEIDAVLAEYAVPRLDGPGRR